MDDKKVRQAINTQLSHIVFSENQMQSVMGNLAGNKIMKRKARFVLVCIVVMLVCITGVAIAVSSFFDFAKTLARPMANKAVSTLNYETMVALASQLAEYGYIDAEPELLKSMEAAPEAEAQTIARSLVAEWLDGPMELISFRQLMEKIWGDFRLWNLEQKAWYTQTMLEAGLMGDDHERYVLPDDGHLTAENAVLRAKKAIAFFLDAPPQVIDTYSIATSFAIYAQKVMNPAYQEGEPVPLYSYTTEGSEPVWHIEFFHDKEGALSLPVLPIRVDPIDGSVCYDTLILQIFAHQYGDRPSYDSLGGRVVEAHKVLSPNGNNDLFMRWPLEAKAAWSEEMSAMVRKVYVYSPYSVDYYTRAVSTSTYGLPGEQTISEEDALKRAMNALEEAYNITGDGLLQACSLYVYYDISDAQTPRWRFCFDQTTEMHLDQRMNYRVEINAHDGTVIMIDSYNPDEYSGYDALLRLL